jgi:twitching motility protein PilT
MGRDGCGEDRDGNVTTKTEGILNEGPRMDKAVDWFCFHLLEEGMLDADTCVTIANAIRDEGYNVDLKTFAQTIVDNELCTDLVALQQFMQMAMDEARSLGFPPESAFPDADTPAEPINFESSFERSEAPPIEQRPALAVPLGQQWLADWPDLSQAESLDADGALQLLNDFLHKARKTSCSDVHISAGSYPFVRRFKNVHLIPGQKVVTPEVAEAINLAPMNSDQREQFAKEHDIDYSYSISEEDRYRTNVLRQRLGVAGSYRLIDKDVRGLPDLGFQRPEVIERLTTHHQGLILVTGPAGCGKSSTLASLVDYINRNRHDHIITVEDPIEVIHRPINCNITQRELNTHTRSFGNALRAALREDPDIIVIGELRDLETIEMAIRSSETGHLVIGTLHTGSAATTMDRILDVFPPNQQAQIRAMVSESLKGVICQQLLPNFDNTGVVLAAEIMLGTLAVSNLIREGKTFQLPSTIQTGRNIGMSTMEQSYFDLYMAGVRSFEQTKPLVTSEELVRRMQQNEAQKAADAAGITTKKRGWGFSRK